MKVEKVKSIPELIDYLDKDPDATRSTRHYYRGESQLPYRLVPKLAREPIRLWNRPELLVLFAGLLLAEWLLRKRMRLI